MTVKRKLGFRTPNDNRGARNFDRSEVRPPHSEGERRPPSLLMASGRRPLRGSAVEIWMVLIGYRDGALRGCGDCGRICCWGGVGKVILGDSGCD